MRLSEADWCKANNPEFLFDNGGIVVSKRQKHLWGIACVRSVAHLFPEPEVADLLNEAEANVDGLVGDDGLSRWSEATAKVRLLARPGPNTGSLLWLPFYAAGIGSEPDWHAVHITLRAFSLTREHWERQRWPGPFPGSVGETVRPRKSSWQAQLLRDIVGNPYTVAALGGLNPWKRSRAYVVVPPPEGNGWWRTPQVRHLAEAAYYERLPDGRLDPVCLLALADSLEEVGFDVGVGEAVVMALRGEEGCPWCEGAGTTETPTAWEDCVRCGGTGLLKQIERYRGFWPVDWVLGKE